MKKHSNNNNVMNNCQHPLGWAALAVALAAAFDASAATVTNNYNTSSNFPGAYIISPTAGNGQVDIWAVASNASFTVTTNLSINPAANASATLLLDGSTNSVLGIGAPSLRAMNIIGSGTGIVSLVNNALLTVSVYAELNSSGLGILSLSNSTMVMAPSTHGLAVDYSSSASSTNRLVMYSSTLNMNNQPLGVGGSGGYGEALIQNSILTNLSIGVANGNVNGSYGFLSASNSAIYMAGLYSLVVGGSSNRIGTMVVDHSTWSGVGNHYLVGGYQGTGFNDTSSTGFVALANGTVANFAGSVVSVGRAGAVGQLSVSNSSLTLGNFDIGGWQDGVPGEAFGGHGTVLIHDGTNTVTGHAWLGSTPSTLGEYSADGASIVVIPSIVVGYALTSTGTFTVAGTTTVFVTNAAHTAALEIGDGGKGTFTMNGGTLNVDKLLTSNGASSVFSFNAGTINTRSTIASNGTAFTVGDGSDLATISLLGGTHIFASGLTIAQNATLMGTGTVQGATTVLGTLSPGFSPGLLHITGGLTLAANATNAVDINGPTVGTQYDQVDVTGAVSLAGSVLSITLGYNPSTGTVFTIINNDGIDPVTGTFAGLPNGFEFSVPGMSAGHAFNIRYNGGTGNDVTLSVVPEPSIGGLFSIAAFVLGFAARSRFRRNQ